MARSTRPRAPACQARAASLEWPSDAARASFPPMTGPGSATDEIPVRPGDVLAGKYRVDQVLGVGGMGVVVAATHLQLDQRVALKFMLPEALRHPSLIER